jgi:nicotinamidase/pyrazinamidase
MQLAELSKDPQTALLVIDMQPDFYSKGALPVKGGEEIVEKISLWAHRFQTLVFTQDFHPEGHMSFASSYTGKKAFEILTYDELEAGEIQSPLIQREALLSVLQKLPQKSQVLWPDHCVAGTAGAEIDKRLPLERAALILRKGMRSLVDSYSAFYENDGSSTGLGALLRDRGIKRVVPCGLAGDYCVYWSAKDAIREGFELIFDESATRFVNFPEKSRERALEDLKVRGAKLVSI